MRHSFIESRALSVIVEIVSLDVFIPGLRCVEAVPYAEGSDRHVLRRVRGRLFVDPLHKRLM
ncbi:hypothetical protein [Streptomyces sp. NPDC048438]|uniref:hypothetical protein n=1 Tax=Streptomyces sp. NPDC048438 TaxID=3365551 RepID=UPI0037126A9D